MISPVSLGDSFCFKIGTCSASTGAATNADSTPTITVEEDGVAMGYAPTVANVATGEYRVTVDATVGNGFEAGKRYCMSVSATVGGINGRDGVGEFEVLAVDLNTALDTNIGSRLATAGYTAPPSAVAIRSEIDANSTKLDVATSTRLAAAAYTAPDNATIALIAGYTDSIEGRLPAALVGGRMDSHVGAMAADVLTAAALAADAVAEIQAGLAAPGDSMALTPAAIDAILDEVVDGGYTVRQLMRGFAAALMAKLSGADINLPVFRDVGDTKDRISAVTDAAGNRTAVTLDLT